MGIELDEDQVTAFRRDGYVFPLRVMSESDAGECYARFRSMETNCGGALTGPLRYKPHILITWLNKLIHHPRILDSVEGVIGTNILCWASGFFNKGAQDTSYVSWQQDSTYWGLSEK